MVVYRVYSEKKEPYAVEARALLSELRTLLGVKGLDGLRILNRYDVEGISRELFERSVSAVFSEPQLDDVYFELPEGANECFAVEYLPGQFDARADGAAQCVQLLSGGARPTVASARVYLLYGDITADELEAIQKYLVNPVEARLASLEERTTLEMPASEPDDVAVLEGFCSLEEKDLADFIARMGLAMDERDLACCRDYFAGEKRDPTLTELRILDTYWSDHCRHTTFNTVLRVEDIKDPLIKAAYDRYRAAREFTGIAKRKPETLMDLATVGKRYLEKTGELKNLDDSDEINACSVKIEVDENGKTEPWLLLFKNETHNHPTEIEPFGGAATCIGGAIRDPLANRGYIYQAMRLTGAGDPRVPVSQTLAGKLPQRKICTSAAAGYSSYGNQVGLATGIVDEIYHEGYLAKRMEIGAVLGAARLRDVRREEPKAGDIVLLVGGRTGRDGCGGATGSSKAHGADSLASCGAEVQKGNAPEERKLQRLFRSSEVSRMIKRCNDFGAGGVSVAVGELADSLDIDLDAVPKKYLGLDGTELAISESQERMAVVTDPEDAERFIEAAKKENLEATRVAVVTDNGRLKMRWRGKTVCDIARAFLDTNGAPKSAAVKAPAQGEYKDPQSAGGFAERMAALAGSLEGGSRKGLAERFDSTIGAASVLMPFGGARQKTPAQSMAAKLPTLGETAVCSGMAWGCEPHIASESEYRGGYLAVLSSLAKLAASGFKRENAYLTMQEYFERLGSDPERWGRPFAALLGALDAQLDYKVAAIGGKDSMSGSFEDIDVPPTLAAFAVAHGGADNVISPEFKRAGSRVALLAPKYKDALLPEKDSALEVMSELETLISQKKVLSAYAVGRLGIAEAVFKMALGNGIGFEFEKGADANSLFEPRFGAYVVELAEGREAVGAPLGKTTADYTLSLDGENIDLAALEQRYDGALEEVYPTAPDAGKQAAPEMISHSHTGARPSPKIGIAKPRVLIPVFPGTNCEYDSARAFERAGARAEVFVVRNLTSDDVEQSAREMSALIEKSEIVFIPGGFSGGDEPEGSAKLIAAFFRSQRVTEAVRELLIGRRGLMLGICNGFQALLKLGLLPFGDIRETDEGCPTLTFNTIGRHQSAIVKTRISSDLSPWLARAKVGDIKSVAISHGEGRFVGPKALLRELARSGQIAAQYCDMSGAPSMDIRYNPNGSMLAVEALTSPDGRILGKMGHSERAGAYLYKNVAGDYDSGIFAAGVDYFNI